MGLLTTEGPPFVAREHIGAAGLGPPSRGMRDGAIDIREVGNDGHAELMTRRLHELIPRNPQNLLQSLDSWSTLLAPRGVTSDQEA